MYPEPLWITKNKWKKIVVDLGDSKKGTNTLSAKRRRQNGAEQAFREITAESIPHLGKDRKPVTPRS